MIYQTINFTSFAKAFKEAGRKDQFSIYGLKMLYNWLEDVYSEDNFELDVIGLCCQFAEYTLDDFLNDYNIDGIDSVEDLKNALCYDELDMVIFYDIDNDVILVNSDY